MGSTYIIISIILLLILAGWAYFKNKKKNLEKYGPLVLLHTQKFVRTIDKIANAAPRFWGIFAVIGVIVGFFFMINAAYGIYKSALYILQTPKAQAGASLVLPGMKIMGIQIPVLGWLAGIIVLLVVHEFSHGIIARAEKIKVLSVGAVLLGFLPIGAFVKPDEAKLKREKTARKLKIFAAGSFANIIVSTAIIAAIIFIMLPAATSAISGIKLTGLDKDAPAYKAGMREGMTVAAIDSTEIQDFTSFNTEWKAKNYKAGDNVLFETDKGNFEVTLDDRGDGLGRAGITFCGKGIEKLYYPLVFFAPFLLTSQQTACQTAATMSGQIFWAGFEVLLWVAIINLGVGVVNLLPIKPLDGGLMMEAVVKKFVRREKISEKIVLGLSLLFFLFLLINIIGPQLRALLNFLGI